MKIWVLIGLAAAILAASPVLAQGLPAGPPQEFLDSMPQAGPLYLRFCLIGIEHPCFDYEARVWGQVCDSEVAEHEATNEDNPSIGPNVAGWVPPGFRYAGWHCGKKFHYPNERVFGGGNWGD